MKNLFKQIYFVSKRYFTFVNSITFIISNIQLENFKKFLTNKLNFKVSLKAYLLIQALLEKERERIENIYDDDLEEEYDPEKHEYDQDEEYSSEDEEIDHQNYKGIYIDDEPGQKFTDPETGAHFKFSDM